MIELIKTKYHIIGGLWLIIALVACQSKETPLSTIEEPAKTIVVSKNSSPTSPKSTYQNGDLIFNSSISNQSAAIQLVTQSPYSHVGILYQEKGKWYVYEAISTVQLTPLERWIKRGNNEHHVVKRLKNTAILTPENLQKMKQVGQQYQGKRYDLKFEWSDEKLYCSELVWKIYEQALGIELGQLQQLKEFNLDHPMVQQKVRERYGKDLPLEQWVISPARIFECGLLDTVSL